MSGYLGHLVDRALGVVPVLRPRPRTLFEPAPVAPAGLEELALERPAPSLKAYRPTPARGTPDRPGHTGAGTAADLPGRYGATDPVRSGLAGDGVTSHRDVPSARMARATDREATRSTNPEPLRAPDLVPPDAGLGPGPTHHAAPTATSGTHGSAVTATTPADQEPARRNPTSGPDPGSPVHSRASTARGAPASTATGTTGVHPEPTTGPGAAGAPSPAADGLPPGPATIGIDALQIAGTTGVHPEPTTGPGAAGAPSPAADRPPPGLATRPTRTDPGPVPPAAASGDTSGSAVAMTTQAQHLLTADGPGIGGTNPATTGYPPGSAISPAGGVPEAATAGPARAAGLRGAGLTGAALRGAVLAVGQPAASDGSRAALPAVSETGDFPVRPATPATTGLDRTDRAIPSRVPGMPGEGAPTVTVHIGRVEIRTPPQPPPPAEPEPGPQQLSLEAYLERRNSGSR
jgi:hypothetical protein